MPSGDVSDGDNATCITTPSTRYPFRLQLLLQVYDVTIQDGVFSVYVTGHNLACTSDHVFVGFKLDSFSVEEFDGLYKVCVVVDEVYDVARDLLTCQAQCDVDLFPPTVIYVEAGAPGSQLCEVTWT